MGLFNKHTDDDNDFILDFTEIPNAINSNAQDDMPDITPWDSREHSVSRNHAMTVEEILGIAKNENTKIEADKPETFEVKETENTASDAHINSAEELIRQIKEDTLKRASEKKADLGIIPENNEVEEVKPQLPNEVTEIKDEKPKSEEKRMSPLAQQLYDRMMAERKKAKEGSNKTDDNAHIKSDESSVITSADKKDEENLSADLKSPDDIFNTLSLSIGGEKPLSLKKTTFSNSLLDKCRTYVTDTPEDQTKMDSIDTIIHSAESDARERLKRFYEETEKGTKQKYEFERFGEDVESAEEKPSSNTHETQVIDDISTSAPVIEVTKPQLENDNSGTRIIDFMNGNTVKPQNEIPRIKDTAQMEALRYNLKKLAEDPLNKTMEHEQVKVSFTGIEEDELPEDDTTSFLEEKAELDDYNSIEDAESVKADLDAKKVSIVGRLIPTAIITVLLFIIDYIMKDALLTISPALFMSLNALFMAIGLALNFNTVKGLGGVVFGTPDMDTPFALSFCATTLYTVVTMIWGNMDSAPILAPIGLMDLTFNLIGKRMLIKRISLGFSVIANEQEKYGVTFVEDKVCASVMARGSVIGEVLINVGKKTRNITNYLKNSYSEDSYEKKLSPLTIFTLIAGAVLALIGFFSNGSLIDALCSFALVTLAACPPSSLLICNLPFLMASKKLKGYGAMIAGHEAVNTIANANAVAFKASDLFPKGTIKLYNMQVITNGAVDKYISYAASVLGEAQSPLVHVFEEILETAETDEKKPVADSIKYENNMGISGWVDEHRIFIGNRTLMEGHNILTPSLELDKKILREGYFPLYFAIDQELCALFIVGYEADEEITYELRRLCNTGVTMLVTNNDPNISDAMLCDYFGLYPDSIKVLNSSGATAYSQVTQFRENLSAPASYLGDIKGLLATITASIRMKSLFDILVVLQIIFVCLGIAAVGYFVAVGMLLKMPLILFSLGQLLTAFITYLITKFKD